jgi:putative transposase
LILADFSTGLRWNGTAGKNPGCYCPGHATSAAAPSLQQREHPSEPLMARLPRYTAQGLVQHIVQRGNNRVATFATSVDYQFFRECLQTACAKHGCQIHAYAFMTNHVHLLMTPSSEDGIGKVMQSVGRRYVQYFNRTYRRTGTLWEGRYRATLIDSEQYLLACYRYVELNPVRAGLVARPEDYPWSSYRANALGATDALVTPHERYGALGAEAVTRQAAYRALFENALNESTLRSIRETTNKAWALGDVRFREGIERLLHRRTEPLPRGGNRRRQGKINGIDQWGQTPLIPGP